MIAIRCILGSVTDGLQVPDSPISVDDIDARQWFSDASGQDIELTIDDTLLGDTIRPSLRDVESLDLHRALSKLTNNPSSATKVQRIGLIFAGSYKPKPTVLGLMFDWGKKFAFDRHDTSEFHGVAREGCAIFLDAIRQIRPQEDDYRRQIGFTAIHELGHVFNLQHPDVSEPPSFMSPSLQNRAYTSQDGAYRFLTSDQQLLCQCSQSPYIWPGGSTFRDLGPLAAADFASSEIDNSDGPVLSIDVSPREFWPFEPVELDVQLTVKSGCKSWYRVPDIVDPGYEQFTIWIQAPNGEVRKYRSPRHYCWNGNRITVSAAKPFYRDISIFVEAGGYTFNQAGTHFLHATLQAGSKRLLVSNRVEIYIRPSRPNDAKYRRMRDALTKPSHVRLMYYRRASSSQRETKVLEEFSNDFGKTNSAAAVRYALGRANMKAAELVKNRKRSQELMTKASRQLEEVSGSPFLSEHRLRVAERLLSSDSGTA